MALLASFHQPTPAPPPPPPIEPSWSPHDLLQAAGLSTAFARDLVWIAIYLAVVTPVVLLVLRYLFGEELKGAVSGWNQRLLVLLAAVITVALVPIGGGIATVSRGGPGALLGLFATVAVGAAGASLADGATRRRTRLVLRAQSWIWISSGVAFGISLLGPLAFAGTLSAAGFVDAQRFTGAWYVVLQPVAFACYQATIWLGIAAPESRSARRIDPLHLGRAVLIAVVVAVQVVVFAGGWWFPGMERLVAVVAGLLGNAVTVLGAPATGTVVYAIVFTAVSTIAFGLKAIAFLLLAIRGARLLPRTSVRRRLQVLWSWVIPAAGLGALASAVFYSLAIGSSQGGVFGITEVTVNGLWTSWVGYVYFLLAAGLTAGLTWPVIVWWNGRTV